MRDKERIKIILEKLEELWTKTPDLRLGQLITNLNMSAGFGNDCFFIEDDKLLKQIENEINELEFRR